MYPLCLDIKDKLCVVVGGGAVAERKVRSLLEHAARVRLVSPQVTPYLQEQAGLARIQWLKRGYAAQDLAGALLVFAATASREVQEAVQRDAVRHNLLLNIADDPNGCGFHVPAVIRRGDLTLAISTNGKSPAVAAMLKKELEGVVGEEYGILLELVALVRAGVVKGDARQQQKRILFKKLLHRDIISWIREGRWSLVEAHFTRVLGETTAIDWATFRQDKT
ncbi:precorrin-2 dehydrogenase/sirohydrochlorin ferrochelatase family protein [Desulfogranum mediterraneum]|uniref:precorrin-2 dehydrogenase/sirohydrochlorin ferrochelatase family protein n=1 Tax=Desulfogranum mediterraneum TaxID=160661 RepID=UPI000404F253|nr:bifunctional precorrin-2 dehydrogenase/sirohydrochlorin ferrochelatase [Desulfogranum mediterraneum]